MIFWKITPVKEGTIMQRTIAVIGGGASGMMSAIKAAESGAKVTIFEHNKLGKKILSTGNGKCNLTNRNMSTDCFFSHNMDRLQHCLHQFGVNETIHFFENAGLYLKEKNGYFYPLSEQASVVLQVLLNRVKTLSISVIYEDKVTDIKPVTKRKPGREVMVVTNNIPYFFDAVIICCGSQAAPKTGSDGSGYKLAEKLGHKILPILPSLVQLRCDDKFCKELAGIRTEAKIHIYDQKKKLWEESGELQLTDYGLSGIPIFQLSGYVNRYLFQHKNSKLIAVIDFMPHMGNFDDLDFCQKRRRMLSNTTVEEFFCGILNQKLMKVFIQLAGLQHNTSITKVSNEKLLEVYGYCRHFTFHISGSNGFDNAQVCTGGVDLNEVTDSLESIYNPGVYFAGEILDVDGKCGGYNLQWAWTSGCIAGEAAAGNNRSKTYVKS